MNMTETQIRELAHSWRMGAVDLRNEFRDELGKVRSDVEMGALSLESCAARLEAIAAQQNELLPVG